MNSKSSEASERVFAILIDEQKDYQELIDKSQCIEEDTIIQC